MAVARPSVGCLNFEWSGNGGRSLWRMGRRGMVMRRREEKHIQSWGLPASRAKAIFRDFESMGA
jgi:hypothetical protein